MTCPYCKHEGMPVVTRQMSTNGWVLFIVLLLVCLPLCWLPFIMESMKEDVKKCASCGTKWG